MCVNIDICTINSTVSLAIKQLAGEGPWNSSVAESLFLDDENDPFLDGYPLVVKHGNGEPPLYTEIICSFKTHQTHFQTNFFSGISSHIPTSPHLVEEQLETLTCVQPQTDFLLTRWSVEVSGIAWYSYSYGKIQLFAQKAATMFKLYRYRCSGSNFWCFTTNGKVAKV